MRGRVHGGRVDEATDDCSRRRSDACRVAGVPAADDREVASLSTTAADDATTDTTDTEGDTTESHRWWRDPSEEPVAIRRSACASTASTCPTRPMDDNGGVMVQIGGPGQEPGKEALDREQLGRGQQGLPDSSSKRRWDRVRTSEQAEDQKKMQEQALGVQQVHPRARHRHARPAVPRPTVEASTSRSVRRTALLRRRSQ